MWNNNVAPDERSWHAMLLGQ